MHIGAFARPPIQLPLIEIVEPLYDVPQGQPDTNEAAVIGGDVWHTI